MNELNIDEYFANRLSQSVPPRSNTEEYIPEVDGMGKQYALERASAEKIKDLQAITQKRAESREINKNALVTKLGLDPEGFAGGTVNTAASLASGATRFAGQIAALPANLLALHDEAGLDAQDTEAYNRYLQGTATPDDLARLNAQKSVVSGQQDEMLAPGESTPTTLEYFDRALRARQAGQTIAKFADTSNMVQQDKRTQLTEDLTQDFDSSWGKVTQGWEAAQEGKVASGTKDMAIGLGKLIFNAGESAAKNPGAVTEYIAENLPQLAIGAVGKAGQTAMALSNVGYGADLYQQGITNFQKENKGALPSVEERQRMAMHAAGAILAEEVGDVASLGFMKSAKGVGDEIRTGFKAALKNTGIAGAEGFASEGATEAYQTYAEGEATGKSATAEEIYTGGVIGGLVGGGLTGGGRVLAEGAKATPEHAEKRAQDRQAAEDQIKAIGSGDISAYADPTKPSYNPTKAVQVLFGHSQLDTTSPETRTQNLEKAHEVVSGLEEQRAKVQEVYALYSPEGIQTLEQQINDLKAQRAATPETATATLEKLDQYIPEYEADLADLVADPKKATKVKTQLDRLDQQITSARRVLDEFPNLVKPKEEEITAAVELADSTPDVETSKAAVARVISLSMAHPESFSTESINRLVSNTKNGLSADQRSYLRAISASRITENSLKTTDQVSKEVLEGDPAKNQLGILDYRTKVNSALMGSNQKQADRYLGMLSKFATNHARKAELVYGLYQKARTDGQATQIIPTPHGGWEVAPQPFATVEELRKVGGLLVSAKSPKLVRAVQLESKALAQAKTQLDAAYQLKFASAVNSEATVDSVSQVANATRTDQGQLQSNADSTVDPVPLPVDTVEKATGLPEVAQVQDTKIAQEAPQVTEQSEVVIDVKPARRQGQPNQNSLIGAIKARGGLSLSLLQDITGESSLKKVGKGRTVFAEDGHGDLGALAEQLTEEQAGFQSMDAQELESALMDYFRNGVDTFTEEHNLKQKALAEVRAERASVREKAELYGLPAGRLGALRKKVAKIDQAIQAQEAAVAALGLADRARYDELLKIAIELVGSSNKQLQVLDTILDSVSDTADEATYLNEAANKLKEHIDDFASERITKAQGTKESNQVWTEQDGQGTDEDGSHNDSVEEAQGASETSETPSGKLSLYDHASAFVEGQLGKVVDAVKGTQLYQKLNLVREYLVQQVGKGESLRPLVAEAQFLQNWNPATLEKYLGGNTPNPAQQALLDHFKTQADTWLPLIQQNLVKGKLIQGKTGKVAGSIEDNPEFYFKDPVQFLIDSATNGATMAENVQVAIAQAAYGWVMENAGNPSFNTTEAIKEMFGVKEHEEISQELEEAIRDVGTMEKVIINSMGQRVTQALGFKENDKATQEFLPKLQSSLGVHVMKLLSDTGVIERTEVPGLVIAEGLPERLAKETATGKNVTQGFLRLARNEGKTYKERTLKPIAQTISTLAKGTQGVFTKLFGVEAELIEPSWSPIKSKQQTTKNTDQGIPALLKKFMKWEDSTPNHLREDTWRLFNIMDRENFLAMAGVEEINPQSTHILKQQSMEAVRDALEREYDRAMEYFTMMGDAAPEGLKQALYFPHSVWKQQRVGIAANVINPQSSKLQRHMLYRPEWETEVSSDDEAMLENFALRVAEGLGIKTDKQSNENSLAELDRIMDPQSEAPKTVALRTAVEALRAAQKQDETLSPEQQQAIVAGVKVGGEKMHSLDALMALAAYEEAKAGVSEDKPFKFIVRLMGEVDGVANGPMLSHLLLGAADTAKTLGNLLNKGGFFRKEDGNESYNLYRGTPGNRDLYETTTGHMLQRLAQLGQDNKDVQALLPSLWAVTGQLSDEKTNSILKAGRNIIKTPLTAMLFGSAMKGAIHSMFESFVGQIYDGFETIAKMDPDKQDAARLTYIKHLNQLITAGGGGRTLFKLDAGMGSLLAHDFRKYPVQLKALEQTFNNTLGTAVTQTMEADFAPFLERRNAINSTAQATFELYNAIYQGVRETYIQELMDQGEVAYALSKTGNKVPRHDLTKAQEKILDARLKAINPVVHTYLSKHSNGDLDSGLHISSSSRKLSTDSAYQSQVKFGKPFKGTGDVNFLTTAYQRILSSPGVAMVPMMIHSLDSAISHMAVEGTQVLNVHDAHGSGLKYFTRTAQRLNEMTWKATLNYSPASEIRDAWLRTLKGMDDLLQTSEKTPEVLAQVRTALEKLTETNKIGKGKEAIKLPAHQILDHLTGTMVRAAFDADSVKYAAMEKMHFIDQYALQGGQYNVSESDRQEASDRLKELSGTVAEEVQAMVDRINVAVLGAPAQAAKSPFGEVGKASIASNPEIEKRFKAKPIMTGIEALRVAYAHLDKTNPRMQAFYKELLTQVSKVMPEGLTVRYITPETPVTDVEMVGTSQASGSRGWYVDTPAGHVYVLSSAFKQSGLTAELLIHEILHGVLTKTIENDSSPEVKALVQELESLRAKATAFVATLPVTQQGRYAAALGNVHELVAWGMSNSDFQQNVLNKIGMESKTAGNPLITGLKHFIDTVVGILFKGSTKSQQEIAQNGMTVLINNVSGLMNATQKHQATGKTLAMATPSITDYSTTELYESLATGAVTPSFDAHLRMLLNNLVDKIHGPYGSFKAARMAQTAQDPLSIWSNALQDGAAPLAQELRVPGIQLNDQIAFVADQVYATLSAALTDNEGHSTVAARELAKLYNEVHAKLQISDFFDGDWNTANPQEIQQATETYNALFKMEKVNGDKTDHLARFGAIGLTHPRINQLLQVNTALDNLNLKDKTFSERLQDIFAHVLDWINGLVTKTYAGQRADTKLNVLVDQLIQIEAKKVQRLKKAQRSKDYLASAEAVLSKGIGQVRKGVLAVAGSSYVRNHSSAVVGAAGGVARIVANDQVEFFLKGLAEYRNKYWQQNLGLTAGLLNNVIGPNQILSTLLRGSKHIESMRTYAITKTREAVLAAYADGGTGLTDSLNKAVSKVLLRTGAHVLLDHTNMVGLQKWVADRTERLKAIRDFENQLTAFGPFKADFIYQSKALAYHLVTGKAASEFVVLNARNIARLYGTNPNQKISEAQAEQAEPIIDALVSLYALDYSSQHQLNQVADLISSENARTDGNGVEFSLVLQRKTNALAKERVFVDGETLMVKGYTPEVYNPYTNVAAATVLEGKALLDQGYVQAYQLPKDPKDPSTEVRHLYVLRDGGLLPYQTGIMSQTGQKHKGSLQENSKVDFWTQTGLQNAAIQQRLTASKQAAVRKAIDSNPNFDPRTVKQNYLVPILNAQGEAVNWRYMMQEDTKDELLERDNRSEQLLGVLAGSVYDKEQTSVQNRKAVEALHAEFKNSFAKRSDSFVQIGPKAPDPTNREIYRLLPEVTKQAIKEIWGQEHMQVPVEMLDIVFGYRKLTISSIFDKVNLNRKVKLTDPKRDEFQGVSAMEHAMVFAVEWMLKGYAKTTLGMKDPEAEQYSKRGAVVIRRAERGWQEAVKMTKDIIVVRSGVVMAGNIMSNFSLLKLQGVSWGDIVHHHRVAMRGASAYQEDRDQLFKLQTKLATGYTQGNEAAIRREIIKLEDAIARNPVKDLIDAGLMPTIVEDVETATDPYSYKSALTKKLDGYTANLNPVLLSAAKTAVIAQDTQLYKSFSQITQLSDFVARYTLYQHLITRKHNPLSKEDAVHEASESFINYDIPMHRTMQYMDDMGFTMFTKYFLGIQRVLMKTARESPLRMLMILALDNYFNMTSLVTESSALLHIGHDPFRTGALQLPGSFGNLATVKAAMSLIK